MRQKITVYPDKPSSRSGYKPYKRPQKIVTEYPQSFMQDNGTHDFTPSLERNLFQGTVVSRISSSLSREAVKAKTAHYKKETINEVDMDLPDDVSLVDLPTVQRSKAPIVDLSDAVLASYRKKLHKTTFAHCRPANGGIFTLFEPEALAVTLDKEKRIRFDLKGAPVEDGERTNGRMQEMSDWISSYHGTHITNTGFLERSPIDDIHLHFPCVWVGEDRKGNSKLWGTVMMDRFVADAEDKWCEICGYDTQAFRKKGFHFKKWESLKHMKNGFRYCFDPDKEHFRVTGKGFGKRIRPRNFNRVMIAEKEKDVLHPVTHLIAVSKMVDAAKSRQPDRLGMWTVTLQDENAYHKAIMEAHHETPKVFGEDINKIHVVGGAPVYTYYAWNMDLSNIPVSHQVKRPDGIVDYYVGYDEDEVERDRARYRPKPEIKPVAQPVKDNTVYHSSCEEWTPEERAFYIRQIEKRKKQEQEELAEVDFSHGYKQTYTYQGAAA